MTRYKKVRLTVTQERKLVRLYDDVKALQKKVQVPAIKANLRMALSFLYQCLNDADLRYEHPTQEELAQAPGAPRPSGESP